MSPPALPDEAPAELEARALLESTEELDLRRYVVAGHCLRFDPAARQVLKEFRQRIHSALRSRSPEPKNFLLWGQPGSGKSYLIQEIASSCGTDVEFRSLNLARLDREALLGGLEGLKESRHPLLCLIDEVDSHPSESWPYEILLPFLEPSVPRSSPTCFCLAGSGGQSSSEFKARIRDRPKGLDLLSRIPTDHELEVAPLATGDRILVAVVQMCDAAAAEGRSIREIEKLALYYLAVHDRYSSARQLRSLASETAQRLPDGETQIRYDYLFPAGDPSNKEFWASSTRVHRSLANRFTEVNLSGLAEMPPSRPAGSPEPPTDVRAERRRGTHRLAVLPFANMSPDSQDEFFADGLTEEMITELSRIPGCQVIARTSVMRYKGTAQGIKQVASELDVDVALEGSVRKSGNRIRVTAQLIDTRSEAHLWSDRFDREMKEIFELQSEIATLVAGALKVELVPASTRSPDKPATKSIAAYEYYLKGRQFWWLSGEQNYRAAILHFEKAIELDPDFALAYCGLADSHALLGNHGYVPLEGALERTEAAARKALALAPDLADAHVSLAPVLYNRYDWVGAERELRRAIALDPNSVLGNYWLAVAISVRGKLDESLELARKVAVLDPLARQSVLSPSVYLYLQRDYEGSLAYMEAVRQRIGIQSEFYRGLCEIGLGRFDAALEDIRKAVSGPMESSAGRRSVLAVAYALAGMAEDSQRVLQPLMEEAAAGKAPAGVVAMVFAALGQNDRAFEWYDRAYEQRSVLGVEDLVVDPLLDPIRSDPRFISTLRKFNHS